MLRASSQEELRAARQLGASRAWLVATPVSHVIDAIQGVSDDVCVVTALSGAPVSCADVRACARHWHESGLTVVADASVTGLCGCVYGQLGADVTVVGIRDGLSLVAVVDGNLVERLRQVEQVVTDDGASREALHTVLEEGARWWRQASDVAQVAASYLRCHPAVEEVRYPGLKGDPSFSVAARTLQNGFGPYVDYRLSGDEVWNRVACEPCDPKELVCELERELKPAFTGATYANQE